MGMPQKQVSTQTAAPEKKKPKTKKMSFFEATFKKYPRWVNASSTIQITSKKVFYTKTFNHLMQTSSWDGTTSRALQVIRSSAGPSFQSEICGCEGSHLENKKDTTVRHIIHKGGILGRGASSHFIWHPLLSWKVNIMCWISIILYTTDYRVKYTSSCVYVVTLASGRLQLKFVVVVKTFDFYIKSWKIIQP